MKRPANPVFIFGPDTNGRYHTWTMDDVVDSGTPIDGENGDDLAYQGLFDRIVYGLSDGGTVRFMVSDNYGTSQIVDTKQYPSDFGVTEYECEQFSKPNMVADYRIRTPPSGHYRVVYEIDAVGENVLAAALEAEEAMTEPRDFRPVLTVITSRGKSVTLDLHEGEDKIRQELGIG